MSRTINKNYTPRLPMEAVMLLRSKGGAQGTPKGSRGYNRQQAKAITRKENDND